MVSEYEQHRNSAIEERFTQLKGVFSELQNATAILNASVEKEPVTPRRRRRLSSDSERFTTNVFSSGRSSPPVTRARSRVGSAELFDRPKTKLPLRFRFQESSQNIKDDKVFLDEEDYSSPKSMKRKRMPSFRRASERVILMPDEITDFDLQSVATSLAKKVYNSSTGTCCHQCRQKTVDFKTICRSSSCVGVRGQFCGPCLRIRYGEDITEALKNPDWTCPPCRGICNCSICRTNKGVCCTGIMIHIAMKHGFTNVKDYLENVTDE